MTRQGRLATAKWEADRHAATLADALRDWCAASAPDLETLESHPEPLRILDQLLFRFTTLQDALGLRMVPATLTALSVPFEEWSIIDRLNRLEKLGFLRVDDWLQWRETRDRLAHEDPDEPKVRFAVIQAATQAAEELLGGYRVWRSRFESPGNRD